MNSEFKTCSNLDGNKRKCACSYVNCANHGLCCRCVASHLSKRELPQCFVKAGV